MWKYAAVWCAIAYAYVTSGLTLPHPNALSVEVRSVLKVAHGILK